MPKTNIFESYRIESNANNTIAMEVFITPFVQALRSGNPKGNDHRDEAQTTIRLAKRQDEAVLCIEVKGTTRDGKKLNVSHEVHILVRLRDSNQNALTFLWDQFRFENQRISTKCRSQNAHLSR